MFLKISTKTLNFLNLQILSLAKADQTLKWIVIIRGKVKFQQIR